ncbi:UNVERIFIED_CONTAM: glutathione synthase/RimK-type ligase-like ATP-grasp enzyme [Acetivibrio alkalicellulosi]
MNIILVGQSHSKRKEYFIKAARELGVEVRFFELGSSLLDCNQGNFIKIDPPLYTDSQLSNLNELVKGYIDFLQTISQKRKLRFLNSPESIIHTLDKVKCKEMLVHKQIAITPLVQEDIIDIKSLHKYARENRSDSLFIKPRYGSGAAGVTAYRYNPLTCSEVVYTSMNEVNGEFFNTKRIRRINKRDEIERIVNFILSHDYIIEKWIPKPKFKGLSYDLRVVYQFGKIDFMVARCSTSPITNLHLNNSVMDIEKLNLSERVIHKIEVLCKDAVDCFKGLTCAGIDILLKGRDLEPVIIEINSQGDLIYQDIFNQNAIYKNQIMGMVNYGKFN